MLKSDECGEVPIKKLSQVNRRQQFGRTFQKQRWILVPSGTTLARFIPLMGQFCHTSETP